MLEHLFVSKPRVKILALFFQFPKKEFYARQIVKLTRLDPGNVLRELDKLADLNLLVVRRSGQSRFFKLQPNNPYKDALKKLFTAYRRHGKTAAAGKKAPQRVNLTMFNDPDPWMLGEDIPDMDLFFSQIWLSSFVKEFKKTAGVAYKKIMCVFNGYHLRFFYGENDAKRVGDYLVERFLKNPAYAKKINRQIIFWSDKLRSFAQTVPQDNLKKLSNADLWRVYAEHDRIHTIYYQWGWIPVAVDMFHNNLTEKLKQYLRGQNVPENQVNEYLVILTQPTKKSPIQIEQDEFMRIAIMIQKDKYHRRLFKELYDNFLDQAAVPYGLKTHTPQYEQALEEKMEVIKDKIKPEIYRLIENHYQKYFYVKHMWIGKEGVYSFDYYLKELVKLVNAGANLEKKYRLQAMEIRQAKSQRHKLIQRLKIKDPWRSLIDAWGDFMITKIYRRFAQIFAVYQMQAVLAEIARRFGLSLMQVRFMLKDEVKAALLNHAINKSELKKRTRFCVYWVEKGREAIFTGETGKNLARPAVKAKVGSVNEIKGQTGCIGKARGAVKIIIRPADMVKFKQGDILVSIATDPDIVPAMKKAAAIVTEQGGVTSHAAIVSRELNIPCVIGTKIATRVLKDGDLVEVDANQGIVKKI